MRTITSRSRKNAVANTYHGIGLIIAGSCRCRNGNTARLLALFRQANDHQGRCIRPAINKILILGQCLTIERDLIARLAEHLARHRIFRVKGCLVAQAIKACAADRGQIAALFKVHRNAGTNRFFAFSRSGSRKYTAANRRHSGRNFNFRNARICKSTITNLGDAVRNVEFRQTHITAEQAVRQLRYILREVNCCQVFAVAECTGPRRQFIVLKLRAKARLTTVRKNHRGKRRRVECIGIDGAHGRGDSHAREFRHLHGIAAKRSDAVLDLILVCPFR